ncbi:MarR family transcriptional regulator for hemolysin [Pararhizobium capsulatum DSM 1112]|uniref:MarR family transcriptional regulator for hemolysin n=1 Tax=Pararhizobium capsulatum DSM 1112 TaxID=1121113 RepID=A0ABU0BNC6_9HYPH|nr:MarR family transcriptional regulator [Pararhizobium capsulatum]MDQ0319754.1 MarR family transcriptional regulator for hemolysin [Pararhizobium capsulatum DSM 1112]
MPDVATDRDLFDALANVNRKLRVLFDARVKETGLTLSRARVLFTLLRRDGLNQRDLAEELGIETPTTVRLLDGMEKQGFLERRTEATDRRAKRIHLTPHGRQSAEEIEELARQIRIDVLEGIGTAEKQATLKVVNTIVDNIMQQIGKD